MSLHSGRGAIFAPAETELFSMFQAHRKRGLRVNERWLCVQMKKLIRTHYGDEAARSSLQNMAPRSGGSCLIWLIDAWVDVERCGSCVVCLAKVDVVCWC
jgi:hypothetical protein